MATLLPKEIVEAMRRMSPADARRLRDIAVEVVHIGWDIAGIFDPTPISDGTHAVVLLFSGRWGDAILTAAGAFPGIGDLAKAGKFPKWLKTIENAVVLIDRSADAATALVPGLKKLLAVLDELPQGMNAQLDQLRSKVAAAVARHGGRATRVARNLPDISKSFRLPPIYEITGRSGRKYKVKEASGRLGRPGHVKVHRKEYQQRKVSGGSGDDAGHLIGDRFGPPGDARNLSRQNWRQNQGGGTFHDLENAWDAKLQQGVDIRVEVRDFTPVEQAAKAAKPEHYRPLYRKVEWTETTLSGQATRHEILFMNSHTGDAAHRVGSRTKQNIPSQEFPPGHSATVVDMEAWRRRNGR